MLVTVTYVNRKTRTIQMFDFKFLWFDYILNKAECTNCMTQKMFKIIHAPICNLFSSQVKNGKNFFSVIHAFVFCKCTSLCMETSRMIVLWKVLSLQLVWKGLCMNVLEVWIKFQCFFFTTSWNSLSEGKSDSIRCF